VVYFCFVGLQVTIVSDSAAFRDNRKEFSKSGFTNSRIAWQYRAAVHFGHGPNLFWPTQAAATKPLARQEHAEFRRASEDFKRTWDREVSLEEVSSTAVTNQPAGNLEENSIVAPATAVQSLQPPMIEAIAPDRVIARQTIQNDDPDSSAVDYAEPASSHSEPSRKRDWL